MSVVGRAYVTVRAVTRQVPGDIKDGVNKALGDADSQAVGEKLGGQIGSGAKKGIADSDVGKGVDESLKKHDFDKSGRDAGTHLGQAIGDSLLADTAIEKAFRSTGNKLNIDSDGMGQKIGSKLGSAMVSGVVLKLGSIATVGLPLVSDALTAIGGLSASAVSLVSTVGPTAAAAGAVGGAAMTSLLTTIGTVTLAFKTQSDALDEFKGELRPVRDEFRDIGQAVQRNLLPALSEAATRSTAALGPTLRRGLVQTGDAVGHVAVQFARLSESAQFQQNLGRILESNAGAMRRFGGAAVNSVDSLTILGSESTGLVQRFSKWTGAVAENIDVLLQDAQATGDLERFFNRAGDTAADLGDLLGTLTHAIYNVFSAGLPEGRSMLGTLNDLSDRFLGWTESIEGQDSLAQWFENGTEIAGAFGHAISGLVEGLGEFAGGTDEAAGTLRAIGDALPTVGGLLGGLSEAAREVLRALGPSIDELGNLVPQAERLGDTLADHLGPAIRDIGPDLVKMIGSAMDIAENLGPVIDVVGNLANIVTSVASPALRGIATILDALPDSLVGIVGAVAVAKIALNSLGNSARFGPSIERAGTAVTGLREKMAGTAGAANKFKVGLSGATGMLGGPWGIALTGATIGLGYFMQKSADTEARVESLRGSLDEQTGALTRNSRELIAAELEKAGAFKDAEALGLDESEVLRALTGDTQALAHVNRVAEDAQRNYNAATTNSVTGARNASAASAEQADHGRDLSNAMKGLREDTDSAVNSQRRIAESLRGSSRAAHGTVRPFGDTRSAIAKMSDVERRFGNAAQAAAIEARGQTAAQRALTRATYAYHEAASKAMQGTIGLEQSIDDAAKEMRQGARGFNINTQAGRDNKLALIGIADAAGAVEGSARKQNAALERGRTQIRNLAEAGGMGERAAQKFADKLISVSNEADKIPTKKSTSFDTPGLDSARSNARNYKGELDAIPENVKTTITEEHVTTRSGRAGGGWIRGPGTETSDSIRYGGYDVSNREFIVNAQAARRNAKWLERVNAGATARLSDDAVMSHNTVVNNYSVTIINPISERGSDSIPRSLRRARDLGLGGN